MRRAPKPSITLNQLRQQFDMKMIELGTFETKAGKRRRAFVIKGSTNNVHVSIGLPCDSVSKYPVIARQPMGSKSNPVSKCLSTLLKVTEQADKDDIASIRQSMLAEGESKGIPRSAFNIPFVVPNDKGEGEYGIWINVQAEAPKGYADLKTDLRVVNRDAAGNFVSAGEEYDATHLLVDMHMCVVIELGDVLDPVVGSASSSFGTLTAAPPSHRIFAGTRMAMINREEAWPADVPFVAPPRAGVKNGFVLPWGDKFIVFGTDEYPLPTIAPDDLDLTRYKSPITSAKMAELFREKRMSIVGKDAPDGKLDNRKYFINQEGEFGNVFLVEGNFNKPLDEQAFLLRKTDWYHPKDGDGNPMVLTDEQIKAAKVVYGAMVAVRDVDNVAGYTSVHNSILTELCKERIMGPKFTSVESIAASVVLPGSEPDGSKPDQNFILSLKLRVEASEKYPGSQVRCFEVSDPGEPFTCEEIDGTDIPAARRIMAIFDWGKLKKHMGTWRTVAYSKYMLVSKSGIGSGGSLIEWGGVVYEPVQTVESTGDISDASTESDESGASASKRAKIEE
jgi:hypothetical protein